MDEDTARQIAKLFAAKFIARPDVKAFQRPNGEWYPDESPITMTDLLGHINGSKTMGHYLLSPSNEVKFFAFDIDLQKASPEKDIWWPMPEGFDSEAGEWINFANGDPRGIWENITKFNPYVEDFLAFQMMDCARALVRSIETNLKIPVAVAYSGHKGLHIYGFTGLCSAQEAREGALVAMEISQQFETWRGKNFFVGKCRFNDCITGWPQLSVEIFPKQAERDPSQKGFGNLIRLPLGINLLKKNGHPHDAKFIDLRYRGTGHYLMERDPIEALTVTDQLAGALPK